MLRVKEKQLNHLSTVAAVAQELGWKCLLGGLDVTIKGHGEVADAHATGKLLSSSLNLTRSLSHCKLFQEEISFFVCSECWEGQEQVLLFFGWLGAGKS